METCPLMERVRALLQAHPGLASITAAHFEGRQVVRGHCPQARTPMRLYGVPVVKESGKQWYITSRLGQRVVPVYVAD